MSNLAETILRDVKRYSLTQLGPVEGGQWLHYPDVLSAITAAMDPAIAERAGEVLERLQKADEYEPLGHDGWDAADLITALLAQNAALRAERDELSSKLEVERFVTDAMHRLAKAAEAQIAALTARVEGLTGAAKRVLAPLDEPCRHDHHGYCQTHFVEAECSVAALRAALSATTEEGHE